MFIDQSLISHAVLQRKSHPPPPKKWRGEANKEGKTYWERTLSTEMVILTCWSSFKSAVRPCTTTNLIAPRASHLGKMTLVVWDSCQVSVLSVIRRSGRFLGAIRLVSLTVEFPPATMSLSLPVLQDPSRFQVMTASVSKVALSAGWESELHRMEIVILDVGVSACSVSGKKMMSAGKFASKDSYSDP